MAALIRHGFFKSQISTTKTIIAGFATKAEKKKGIDRKVPPKIDSNAESLLAKGFLRSQREYSPSDDVAARVDAVCRQLLGDFDSNTKLNDLNRKFQLFVACCNEFDHSVPNSLLHTIETVKDLRDFYQTPVITTTPLDRMRNMELPENLHVQFDYKRFNPDTDGQTAFNHSSTLVTGLKYKNKYPGHVQGEKWYQQKE